MLEQLHATTCTPPDINRHSISDALQKVQATALGRTENAMKVSDECARRSRAISAMIMPEHVMRCSRKTNGY